MQNLDIATVLDILIPGADYRGSLTENTEVAYDSIVWGDVRPKPAWTEIEFVCSKPCEEATWNGSEWTVDYTAVKTARAGVLAAACKAAITLTPVSSSALGDPHSYDCRETDQDNARAAYTLAEAGGVTKNIMCNDGSRFQSRAHTAAQALIVVGALFDHVEAQRIVLGQKIGAVDAIKPEDYATPQDCIDAINAVVW